MIIDVKPKAIPVWQILYKKKLRSLSFPALLDEIITQAELPKTDPRTQWRLETARQTLIRTQQKHVS